MSTSLRVTLLQADLVWEDPEANRRALTGSLHGIAGATDLVVLPEMFTTGFSMQPGRMAEEASGPTAAWLRQLARDLDAAIVGSVMTRDGGRHYNRLLWATPDGALRSYDKRHLFRMGREDKHYAAGDEPLLVEWRGFRIAPLICYDLRFPVWSRRRSGYDYDLLLYVANWPAVRRHAWKTLLPARAIENQCYVAAVNRAGTDGLGVAYAGDSVIHSFLGEPLLELPAGPGLATAKLEHAALAAFRDRFPAHLDADRFTLRP
ncbi:MAG: amidohydrolase [Pseudomonadota bacterium]